MKIAKADLVPADANLLPEYGSFAGLEEACLAFCGQVNARLHPVPAGPFTVALGVTRKVDALSLVTFDAGQYPVPHQLAGQACGSAGTAIRW